MIGEEGLGFVYQMMQFQEERIWGAASIVETLFRLISDTIQYTSERKGAPYKHILSLTNSNLQKIAILERKKYQLFMGQLNIYGSKFDIDKYTSEKKAGSENTFFEFQNDKPDKVTKFAEFF